MNIERLKKQHNEITDIASAMAKLFRQDSQKKGAALSQLLAKLAGKLKMHLLAEDEFLYPQLIAASDKKRQVAQAFIDEMGSLGQVFESYRQKWTIATNIDADYEGFMNESRGVFTALSERIKRENSELYPLV